jgi:large repetitive protein
VRLMVRGSTGLAITLAGLCSPAAAQPFGFTHRMVPAGGEPTLAVSFGDVDGDGDSDALVGTWGAIHLERNDGGGVLRDVTEGTFPAWFSQIGDFRAVTLGDFDGDGDLDLLTTFATSGGGQVRLLLNDGAGNFTPTNPQLLFLQASALAVGDVDMDGDLDALIGIGGLQERLFLNNGTGSFADATATNLPAASAGETKSVALGDVDGDGDLDAYLGRFGQDRLYLNGGTGVFTDVTAVNLPAILDTTRAVALGDVDGDGDLDAFAGNSWVNAQNRLYVNDGAGVFTDATATNLPIVNESSFSVSLGDVDGDGDLDALLGIVGPLPGPENRLLLNAGGGVFTDVTATNFPAFPPPLGSMSAAVALSDVDGDGDLDAFAGNGWFPLGRQDRLYLNDGAGLFADVTASSLPALPGSTAIALGDLDGDGDLDGFVGREQERVYMNGGAGVFADATVGSLPVLSDSTLAVALADLDADADLDALTGNTGSDRLFLNGGGGVFGDATTTNLPPSPAGTRALAVGDLDGDGDLDLLLANVGSGNRLYLNGGPAVFLDGTAAYLPTLLDTTRSISLGDLDGDGDLDAFLGTYGQDRLLVNGGAGVFTDVASTSLPALPGQTAAIALGDVDVDGDLDAFLGSGRLLLNGPGAVFTDVTGTNLPPLSGSTGAAAFTDFDEDGDLDLFTTSSPQNRFLVNGGPGVFADETVTNLPPLFDYPSALALGDLDGDGDVDALVAAPDEDRIYTNLSRQLSWRGIPRAGKALTLDLWGPANGSWLLAASAGSGSIPVPPVGTLRLFLPTLFVVGGGGLDPQGRASVSFPVPANPALVGLSFYWQALVGPALRFTNLEITTVTGL